MLLQLARSSAHHVALLGTWSVAHQLLHMHRASTGAARYPSHYDVLGVDRGASASDIKKAFRQRAKALHPDLNAHLGEADAQAFLTLVAAYEVLSDAEQRRLYDAASDTQLPGVLRRAAAATAATQQQQATEHSAPQSSEHMHDAPWDWRWGLADWARHGPAQYAPIAAEEPSGGASWLKVSALHALRRHQHDLEAELHAALVTAFLGPRVSWKYGELPAAFELDERSEPTLSDDLLHLVHGRTLIGQVQLPSVLKLTGAQDAVPQLVATAQAPLLQTSQKVCSSLHDTSSHVPSGDTIDANSMQQSNRLGSCNTAQPNLQGCSQHAAHVPQDVECGRIGTGQAAGQHSMQYMVKDVGQGSDEDINEVQWTDMMHRQHPLLGAYDWRPTGAVVSSSQPSAGDHWPPSQGDGAGLFGSAQESIRKRPCQHNSSAGTQQPSYRQQQQQQAYNQIKSWPAGAELTLGGRAALQAWEQRVGAVSHDSRTPSGADGVCEEAQQQEELLQQASVANRTHSVADGVREHSFGTHQQQQHHHHHQQQQEQQEETSKCGGGRKHGLRPGHRRRWRWLQEPTADWLAADWSFTDESEGVLVLRLVQDGPVTAVAVRDTQQDLQPIKVWLDGVFYAAILDDVVIQPLTGKLMAVLYRFYTPGVHHVYFYLPNTPGASRVTARLRRRWMPPSSTWLFPPRVTSHDRCSWVLEWEGFDAQHKPGWLHPAVYVLTAACYSYELESNRQSSRVAAAGKTLQAWGSKWKGEASRLASPLRSFYLSVLSKLQTSLLG